MTGRVAGRVALVTGAASGIGRGAALLLGAEGACVVVTDVQTKDGRSCADEIVAAGGQAMFLEQDVTDEARWEAVIAETKARFGGLDILVNNAGIAVSGPIEQMSLADWRRQQAINVEGVFLGVKHALPLLRAGGGGSIINISSVAGMKGSAGLAGYCATKGAVRLFSKAVALEGAPDKVRCNSVHPGIIDTPIWNGISDGLSGGNASDALDLDALTLVATPLGVKGFPADIAAGILYLASDESRYVTGTELVIDGGFVTR